MQEQNFTNDDLKLYFPLIHIGRNSQRAELKFLDKLKFISGKIQKNLPFFFFLFSFAD